MDAETAVLFPDTFVDSKLGPIPAGWEIRTLDEVTTYLSRGISPRYTEDGGVLVLNQRCIRDHRVDVTKARRHDPEVRSVAGRFLSAGDILVNSTGVGTLGRIAVASTLTEPTIVDSYVTVVRSDRREVTSEYLGLLMIERESDIERMGEGSTGQTELSRQRLSQVRLVVPSPSVLQTFSSFVTPFMQRMTTNEAQSSVFIALRDALLPKLLSGELRVPEAERVVAGVA